MEPPAADYVPTRVVFEHLRTFMISDRVIDAFMELAEGLPDALPGAKQLRPGKLELLQHNIDTLLREVDPQSEPMREFHYWHRRHEEDLDEEGEDVGDLVERNKLNMWNNKYSVEVLEGAPQFQNPNSFLTIYWTGPRPVNDPLFQSAIKAIIRAIEATTRGIDVAQRRKELRGVGEIAVAKNTPPLMLGKEVGKYLGGKRRRKTKKSRRRVLKNPKTLKKTIR